MDVQWTTAFVDRAGSARARAVPFWAAVTGSRLSPARGPHGEFATLLPADGDAYLRVQRTGEGSGTHLDLHTADVDAAADQARALGASVEVHERHRVCRSPAGIAWCIVPASAGTPVRPAPVLAGDAERPAASLVDQVCLDVPPDLFDAECRFWADLTGWTLHTGSRPEFAVLARPAGIPLRLLLQRLDTPPASGAGSAHLDLACSDVGAVRRLHEALGATCVAEFENWNVMRDPAGVVYCLTRRLPATGMLP